MRSCYIEPSVWNDKRVPLSREEEHHLIDVCRVGKNEEVRVFDGRGREAIARIAAGKAGTRKGQAKVELGIVRVLPEKKRNIDIVLIQAIPKGDGMDWIIEKATEFGVASIYPVVTERVIKRPREKESDGAITRWQRIAISAAKQCGCAWVPMIMPVLGFKDVPAIFPGLDLVLFGSLQRNAEPVHEVMIESAGRIKKSVGLLIGPEGDFTDAEVKMAQSGGALPVSFGSLVLRVETAALYGLSILKYELDGRNRAG